ncbi:hypothetical protein [Colwellia sp. E2M01]|uniref:hypothetical protein n=1 Tax=Colwellia sp. E2M01 TaxID=2841561 RepID=UPI001C082475|nr:hypothetical protein [Colwellia sp. E2M01]MBU2870397.1 hypothetical protein [Colwellia sp. E2M01]
MKLTVIIFLSIMIYGCGGGSSDSPANTNVEDTSTPETSEPEITVPEITEPEITVPEVTEPEKVANRIFAFSTHESSAVQSILSIFESDTQLVSTKSALSNSLFIYSNDKETEYRFDNNGQLIGIYSFGQQATVTQQSDHYLITLHDTYSLIFGDSAAKKIEIPFSTLAIQPTQLNYLTKPSASITRALEEDEGCLTGNTDEFDNCISSRILQLRQKVLNVLVTPWYLPLSNLFETGIEETDLETFNEEELTSVNDDIEASSGFVSEAVLVIDAEVELLTDSITNVFDELGSKLSQVDDIYTNLLNDRDDIGNPFSPIDTNTIYVDGDLQQSVDLVFNTPSPEDSDTTVTIPEQKDGEFIVVGNIDFIKQFPLTDSYSHYYQYSVNILSLADESNISSFDNIVSVSDAAQEIDFVALALASISNNGQHIVFTMGSHANKMADFYRKNILVTYQATLTSGQSVEKSIEVNFSPISVSFKERDEDGVFSATYNKYTGFSVVSDELGTNRVVLNGTFETIYQYNNIDIGTSYFLTYKDGVANGEGWSRNFNPPTSGITDKFEPVSCQYSTTFSMSNNVISGTYTTYYSDNITVPADKHCTVFSVEQR